MIQITPQMRILLAVEPVDFRKGIDGLVAVCRAALGADPLAGALFKCPCDCSRLGARTTPIPNHPSVSSTSRADLRGR